MEVSSCATASSWLAGSARLRTNPQYSWRRQPLLQRTASSFCTVAAVHLRGTATVYYIKLRGRALTRSFTVRAIGRARRDAHSPTLLERPLPRQLTETLCQAHPSSFELSTAVPVDTRTTGLVVAAGARRCSSAHRSETTVVAPVHPSELARRRVLRPCCG